MTQSQISKSYSYSVLLLDSCGYEVTQENIEKIFKALDIEFLPKLASMFCLPKDKLEQYTTIAASAPSAITNDNAASSQKEEAVVEEKVEKKEEEVEFDLDDLFG